jgi:hypothetical protein
MTTMTTAELTNGALDRKDAQIATLRAELVQTTSALHSYSDALTQLIGWAEDGSPEDGYLYALTEAKKVLKDFKVVGSEDAEEIAERIRHAGYLAYAEGHDDARGKCAKEKARLREALEFVVTFRITDSDGQEVCEDSLHEARKIARAALACRPPKVGALITANLIDDAVEAVFTSTLSSFRREADVVVIGRCYDDDCCSVAMSCRLNVRELVKVILEATSSATEVAP